MMIERQLRPPKAQLICTRIIQINNNNKLAPAKITYSDPDFVCFWRIRCLSVSMIVLLSFDPDSNSKLAAGHQLFPIVASLIIDNQQSRA